MMKPAISIEEKSVLVAYLASKIGVTPQELVGNMPFEAMSCHRNGLPVGAALYTNYRGTSIEIAAAGEPGWLSRGTLSGAFSYPFLQLGVWTVLTLIQRNNADSRELNRRLGFTELCAIESGEGRIFDTILYGMTRDKCPWIPAKQIKPRKRVSGGLANGATHYG
jgi:hypothetical protein